MKIEDVRQIERLLKEPYLYDEIVVAGIRPQHFGSPTEFLCGLLNKGRHLKDEMIGDLKAEIKQLEQEMGYLENRGCVDCDYMEERVLNLQHEVEGLESQLATLQKEAKDGSSGRPTQTSE